MQNLIDTFPLKSANRNSIFSKLTAHSSGRVMKLGCLALKKKQDSLYVSLQCEHPMQSNIYIYIVYLVEYNKTTSSALLCGHNNKIYAGPARQNDGFGGKKLRTFFLKP